MSDPYEIRWESPARRAVTDKLPEAVASAVYEFVVSTLAGNPHRVGKQLLPPLDDRWVARRGTYRVLYRIDEQARVVTVLDVRRRGDAYRT